MTFITIIHILGRYIYITLTFSILRGQLMNNSPLAEGLTIIVSLLIFIILSPINTSSILGNSEPDLDCSGDLYWFDPEPGSTITGDITVENIGEPGSLLNWEIESWPEWGTWSFSPENGTNLSPGDSIAITVEVIAPNEIEDDLVGDIKIINLANPDDYCILEAWIEIPSPPGPISYFGFIRNLAITNTTVSFHVIFAFNSNFPRLLPVINQDVELPNNYEGHLSDNFVWATFYY